MKAMNDLRHQSLQILFFTLVLGLVSFFFIDQSLAQYFAQTEFADFRHICREITDVAEGSFYLLATAAVYFSARSWLPRVKAVQKNPYILWNVRRAAGFALSNLLICGILVHILKFIFGRQRPHVTRTFEGGHFQPFNFHWHWHSFPSGHSQVVFAIATLLTLLWPRYRGRIFTVAVGIALTRVILQQHFLSDVIVGAAIGYLGTLWMYELYWSEKI